MADQDLAARVLAVLTRDGPLKPVQVADRISADLPAVRQVMQVLVFEHRIASIYAPDYVGEHAFKATLK
jgi:hypothetical protein